MTKIFKNNILSRILAVILVSVILLISIPIFTETQYSGADVGYGYIVDGSFETGEFWKNGRVKSSTAFDGEYIVNGGSAYLYSEKLSLKKDVTYTFAFWYRNDTAATTDKVAVFYKNTSGKYVTIKSLTLEQTNDWKYCTFEFKHSKYTDFYFGVQGTDVEIDAVSVPYSYKKSNNIIQNGSFESCFEGWKSFGDSPSFKGNGTDGFVTLGISSGEENGIYYDFPTEKEVNYTVSFKYKGGAASFGISRVREEVSSTNLIGEKYALESTDEWKSVTVGFSSMFRTEHRLVIWAGNSGEILIDAVCVTIDSSDNLLKNGGFEDGFNNWKKNAGAYSVVTDPVNSGEKALKQPSGLNNKMWQAVDVEKNTFYQISFAYAYTATSTAKTSWVKWAVSDASEDSVSGYAPETNEGKTGFITGKSHKIENPDWTNVIVTVNSGSYSRLAIAFQTATSNTVVFDDVVIKKVNLPQKIESVLTNAGFEAGLSGWDKDSTEFYVGNVTNSGSGSLKMPNANYYPKISQKFSVQKNEKYVAIFSFRGNMSSSRWAITKAYDNENQPITGVEPSTEGFVVGGIIGKADTWQTVISDVFVPEEDDVYSIKFQSHKSVDGFIDDVLIFKMDDEGSLIMNGDFSKNEIAWAFDSDYFELSNENYGGNGYGMNVLAGFHKTISQSFKTEKNTNYEISFRYKGTLSNETAAFCISKDGTFDFESIIAKSKLETSNDWKYHSVVVNSGKSNLLYVVFQTMLESQYYIDDIKAVKTDKVADTAQSLVRPYFIDMHNANPYNDFPYICDLENNLWLDCGFNAPNKFLGKGTQVVSEGENKYLEFTADNKENIAYIMLDVKPNTVYYANLLVRYDKIDGSKLGKNHISFGFADPDTDTFILTSSPDSEFGRLYTTTMQCSPSAADNKWHMLNFSIKTNDATTLKFMIRGTDDSIDIDNLYIFEEANAKTYVSDFNKISDVEILDESPDKLATKTDTDNLLNEGFDFETDSNFWNLTNSTLLGTDLNKADSKHSIQKNAFYYNSTATHPRRIYYIRWVDVKPNTEYTFSAKCSVTEEGGGAVGILSGYKSEMYAQVTENMKLPTIIGKLDFAGDGFDENCNWQSFGVTFNTKDRNRVGIFVYDGGGAAYIDDIRLFETKNAAVLKEVEDNFPSKLHSFDKSYSFTNGNLLGVNTKTSVKSVLDKLENSEYIRLFDNSGKEITDKSMLLATGMQLRLMDGPVVKDRADVMIIGDVTGDGLADKGDASAILKHLAKVELLSGNYLKAADIDKDGEITVYDSMLNSAAPKSGKSNFILSGPKSFGAGEEINVALICNTNNTSALNGKIQLPAGLFFVSASSDGEFYYSEQEKDVYFSALGSFTKGKVVATFTLQVGNISKYSEAEVLLADVFATTGKDLLKASDFKWTNATNESSGGDSSGNNGDNKTEDESKPAISTRLSVLKLKEAKISPAFDPDIKEYTAIVPFEISKVTLTAVAEYDGAKVTIGDTNLEYVGNNIIKVVVETENGGRRTYKITVTREAPQDTSDGIALWIILLICGIGVVLVAGGVVLTVILIKRKNKKNK